MIDSPASSTSALQTRLTTTFPQTASLLREDLQSLAADPSIPLPGQSPSEPSQASAYFEAFFHSLPKTQSLYSSHASLLRANEEKAARNLALQPDLEALRAETQALFDRAKALEAEWATKEAQLNELQKRFSPSALHFGLMQSASKLNDKSEALANAFVEGLEYPLDDSGTAVNALLDEQAFVKRYKELRKTYHKRRLVADRWAGGQVH
ncbi:uncharacterized protein MEPE_01424 [Melanopsichium pennsylvanicum]|uniref:VPS37 C-terminal domain-containing protein n=2 Tax=Melanopsichium pennsylvanicum TaxID=63383 RepID=A0AAJ4XKD7_9BASI|nr:conserved hypothetical protein [Melanopsichium pennsylvanicum 4]SNX82718.1 uncharacterized protein MEPE_01424 [Melanopsichium pennsylvanicum]